MKNYDTRTYSINDFLEWDSRSQLELSPKFQRRSVWTDNARSFLMDTIIRGKPIPKIFIRQKLNIQTRDNIREVVDGQQRLRTILSYVKDGFKISPKHHEQYGGYYFSELVQIDPKIQEQLLNYELSVDLLVNISDEEVLDIFSRLNSYSVILNEQEKINANHFGPFKTLADKLAHKYNSFWISNRILNEQQVLRMQDVKLVAELIIAMLVGIKSSKQITHYYDEFEEKFDIEVHVIEKKFSGVMSLIQEVFPQGLQHTDYKRIHIFYSLFTAFYHIKYSLQNLETSTGIKLITSNFPTINIKLEKIASIFDTKDIKSLDPDASRFLEHSRRATTDEKVRIERTKYLLRLLK